uniref:C-type lectin domain-containing protein n=1 Tax=Eptatretus burgeri TaxID=7764 RepID=A0A8C4QM11_EPTBU
MSCLYFWILKIYFPFSLAEPTPTEAPARGPCPSEPSLGYWQVLADSCFLFQSDTKLSWMGAAATCSRLGGSLASLKSKLENVVKRYTSFSKKKAKSFWIGLHRSFNGNYSWLDGSSMRYNPRWESNRQSHSDDPSGTNERCVALTIDSKGFSWNDHSCTHRAGYICRAPKVAPRVIESRPEAEKVVPTAQIDGESNLNRSI